MHRKMHVQFGGGPVRKRSSNTTFAGWLPDAETLFSIQRRLADHAFSNARTWPEIQQAHQIWWENNNSEHHFAHRERQDGRHSPLEVLRGMLGRTIPEEVLSRALYASQFTRQIDHHGCVLLDEVHIQAMAFVRWRVC